MTNASKYSFGAKQSWCGAQAARSLNRSTAETRGVLVSSEKHVDVNVEQLQ
jgi:hypothetical protein